MRESFNSKMEVKYHSAQDFYKATVLSHLAHTSIGNLPFVVWLKDMSCDDKKICCCHSIPKVKHVFKYGGISVSEYRWKRNFQYTP